LPATTQTQESETIYRMDENFWSFKSIFSL